MTKIRTINCLAALFAVISLVSQSEKPRTLAIVPNAMYLFNLSAAPRDRLLFLASSLDENRDELNPGAPTIIRMRESGPPVIKALSVGPTRDVDMFPVWSRDGKIVYFETEAGVLSYRPADDRVENIWNGEATGLALSQDGQCLAFWTRTEQDRDHLKLILFDLRNKREKQTWVTANLYGGDEAGFEIAFASDDRGIYARTFDRMDSSPLQRFTIGSAIPEIVSRNITSVVSGENGVYFVTENIENDKLLYALMAVSDNAARVEQLKSDLPCRSLVASGSRRWIICKEDLTGEASLLFDTEKRTFTLIKPPHDNLVVMSNGDIVYSLKGSLLAGNVMR